MYLANGVQGPRGKDKPLALVARSMRRQGRTIARENEPVAKLVAIGAASRKRTPGKLKGQISYTPDAFDPLSDQELVDMGFE